jgi:hypothetical protein
MAATPLANYTLIAPTIAGMVPEMIPDNLSLLSTGVLSSDSELETTIKDFGGNVVAYRGYFRNRTGWQSPTADTDLSVYDLDTLAANLVVVRRNQVFGAEKWANVAAGDVNEISQALARALSYNYSYNVEKLIMQQFLPGLLTSTSAPLKETHTVDHSSTVFNYSYIEEAKLPFGDMDDSEMVLITHPQIYRHTNMRSIVDNVLAVNVASEFNQTGKVFRGNIGGMDVVLNSRISAIDTNTYPIYLIARGALKWIPQSIFDVEVDYDMLKAGGTNMAKYGFAAAIGAEGLTFSGTAPTGISGATDAAIGTVTNWSKITTVDAGTAIDNENIPMACIIAKSQA